MGSVNVNRNVSDIFYRYKMPRIIAKVEGKGNGIKTVVVNMVEVAKAVGRPPTYITKFFGCELGAQTSWTNDRYIVNGSHDASKLQDLLDSFIKKFVLCPECDNPETELLVSPKKGTISQGCKACGFHGLLDVVHKVNTFILKNPPSAATGQSSTETKRSKRSKKGAEEQPAENDASKEENIIEEVNKLEKYENEEDDTGWTVDVSEEAIKLRLLDLSEGAKNITLNDDTEKTEKERLDIFYDLVKKNKESDSLENVQIHKDLFMEANRLDIQHKAPLVLAEVLFTSNIVQEVKKYRNLLLRFTHNDKKAQKYLLGGIEQIIHINKERLMDKVAGIFKLFYDSDILEEDALLEWDSKISKKYVPKEIATNIHDKAKPFIDWLKQAEEEESDDDEDDITIEYNDRIEETTSKKVKENKSNSVKVEKPTDDIDDDVNIDDI